MTNREQKKPTFWGVELNEEEIKSKRLSYKTMAATFDAVMCNNITSVDPYIFDNIESGDFESFYISGKEVSRSDYEERREQIEDAIRDLECEEWETEEQQRIAQEHIEQLKSRLDDFETLQNDIFQFFIVSNSALWVLQKANELVFYSEVLDCYIWGVCHWGTSWDYVLTSLKLSEDLTHLED